jgi:hypothetical protein
MYFYFCIFAIALVDIVFCADFKKTNIFGNGNLIFTNNT